MRHEVVNKHADILVNYTPLQKSVRYNHSDDDNKLHIIDEIDATLCQLMRQDFYRHGKLEMIIEADDDNREMSQRFNAPPTNTPRVVDNRVLGLREAGVESIECQTVDSFGRSGDKAIGPMTEAIVIRTAKDADVDIPRALTAINNAFKQTGLRAFVLTRNMHETRGIGG